MAKTLTEYFDNKQSPEIEKPKYQSKYLNKILDTNFTSDSNTTFAGDRLGSSQFDINIPKTSLDAGELNQIRATNQPFHHELGNFAVQLAGEVVGGTIEGFGYLGELAKGNLLAVDQENILLDLGRSIKEGSRESNPIYQGNPDGFMLGNSENFFANMVSIGSTLSMLIPATGTMKALSMLGKAAGMSRGASVLGKLSKGTQYTLNGIGQATISRQIENNLEAYGTYEQLKQELEGQVNKDTGELYSPEEIEELALEGAKSTYIKGWAMLAQDIPQYLAIGKLFNPMTGQFVSKSGRNAKKLGKYGKAKELAKQSAYEGLEEAYQFVSAEESAYNIKMNAGLIDESAFTERMQGYLGDTEFWNSVTAGAAGGAVFQMAGKGLNNLINNKKRKAFLEKQQDVINKRGTHFAVLHENIKKADAEGNLSASLEARKAWNLAMTLEAVQTDTFDNHIEFFDNLENLKEQDLQEYKEKYGIEDMSVDWAKEIAPKLKEDAVKIRNQYLKYANKYGSTAGLLAVNRHNLENMVRIRQESDSKLSKAKAEYPQIEDLSAVGLEIFERDSQRVALESAKVLTQMQADVAGDDSYKETLEKIDKTLTKLKDKIEYPEGTSKDIIDNDKSIISTLPNHPELTNALASKRQAELNIKKLEKEFSKLTSPEYQREAENTKLTNNINSIKSLDSLDALEDELEQSGNLSQLKEVVSNKRESLENQAKEQADKAAQTEDDKEELSRRTGEEQVSEENIEVKEALAETLNKEETSKVEPVENVTSELDNIETKSGNEINEIKEKAKSVQTNQTGVQIATSYLEDKPAFKEWYYSPVDKIGTKVKITFGDRHFASGEEVTERYNQLIEKFLNDTITPTELTDFVNNVALKVTFLKDGEPITINGQEVFTYLYTIRSGKNELNPEFRKNILNQLKQGNEVISEVEGYYPLEINNVRQDNNIEQVFGSIKESDFVMTNVEGRYVRFDWSVKNRNYDKDFNDLPEVTYKSGNEVVAGSGLIFYKATNNKGVKIPIKLNVKTLSDEDARFVATVFQSILQNKVNWNTLMPDNLLSQLQTILPDYKELINTSPTYNEVIDYFVYFGNKTAGLQSELYLSKGKLYYGGNNNTLATGSDFESVVEYLKTKKRYQIKASKFKNKAYREHIVNSNILTTDVDVDLPFKQGQGIYSGSMFLKPITETKQPELKVSKEEGLDNAVSVNDLYNEPFNTINYTPKGKSKQTYTIKGSKIFNSKGKEVFSKDTVDRRKIFANFAVQQGRAKVVEHKGRKFVVNNKGQIISVTTGAEMKWKENNGDRTEVLKKAGITSDNEGLDNKESVADLFKEQVSNYDMNEDFKTEESMDELEASFNQGLSGKSNMDLDTRKNKEANKAKDDNQNNERC
jgi:hypothetical protein